VHKAEGHALREVFMKHTGLTPDEMTKHTDVTAGDNAQVIRVIANTTGAIGYVSLGEVIKAAEGGLPVRLLKFNGIEPVMENVTNKTYPLFHPLYLISKGEPKGGSRVLLDFLRTREGKEIIRQGKLCSAGIGSAGFGQSAIGARARANPRHFALAIFSSGMLPLRRPRSGFGNWRPPNGRLCRAIWWLCSSQALWL
jgi:hypothetical protein